jgi:YVTN family beta-propeller protein
VTPDGARVYVANHDSNSVSVIDAASNVVVATITAGEEPPQEGQSGLGYGPSGIAIDAAGTCAYVTNQTDGTVSVLDLATNTVIDTILVGGAPGAIAVNPGTSRVAVAVADGANSCVPLIDCATNEVADTVQTAGADPSALACNHDTSRLYVTDFGTDAVEVIQDVPSVATFTPLVGSSGTTVTITGAGFTGTPTIAFNGTSATSCTVESPTRIAVAVPAGATPGKISVTTPSGTATSTADFAVTYALSYAAGPGGSIDGSATQVVGYGASGTAVTAVPDPGYSFVSWDDLFLAPTRTDGPVGADASRTAKFACDYEYSLDGDNATITRYVGTGTSVAVPATLDGHPVVAIGMLAFAARSDLTGVTLPNSLNSIEAGAFDGCTGLTNIGIPAGVTSIGSRAFAFCRGLTAVTLPAGLTSIGDSTFESCESLRGIEIPSGVTSIGSRAFGDCSGVLSLRIGESVATIGDLAFDGCSALREVIVPPAVTSIGYRAFSRCTSMTMLDFTDWGSPGSLSIGESAFQGCTSLASTITVPARVDSIGAGAFTNCANLASVAFIGNAPGTVGAGIFSGTASGFVVTRLYLASGFGPKPPGPWVPTGNPAEGSYTTAYIDPRPTHSITSSAMADGKYLSKWDESRAGGEPVESYLPAGIAVAPSGDVYVADTQNHRIQYFDSTGAYKGQWGSHGSGQGQFDQPVDMALAPDGDVYVADTKNHRIQYFGATGGYKGTFGVEGSGEGQFKAPAGIGVAPNGCVYVADAELNRVQYFDATGVYKGTFGVQGSGDGELSMPVGLAVAPNGDVYVGDWGNGRIQYFGPTGVYKGAWGSDGSGEGQFSQPAFMDIDSGGNVYVPDVFNNRIQYFSATGTYLGQWGTEGSGDEKWPGGFGQPDR